MYENFRERRSKNQKKEKRMPFRYFGIASVHEFFCSVILSALFLFLISCPVSLKAEEHPLSVSGQSAFEAKNYESALIFYNQLIQAFPEREEGYFNRGLCLYNQEKYSEALFDFDQAITLDTLLSEAKLMKGFSMEKRGDIEEAMTQYAILSNDRLNEFPLQSRIKNYHLSVFISKSWYYLLSLFLVSVLFIVLAARLTFR